MYFPCVSLSNSSYKMLSYCNLLRLELMLNGYGYVIRLNYDNSSNSAQILLTRGMTVRSYLSNSLTTMDSYGSLLNLDLIFVISYGVLCIFKCRIQLTQLSLLTLSSPYLNDRFVWGKNRYFTYSAIHMPF